MSNSLLKTLTRFNLTNTNNCAIIYTRLTKEGYFFMNMNVTKYGTITWTTDEYDGDIIYGGFYYTKSHEMSINKFLKKLSYRVNKGGPYLDDCNNATLDYDAFVYQSGEDKYRIKFNYGKNNEMYELSIKDSKEYYPFLKEKLDELAEITELHDNQSEIVKNGEQGKNLSVVDTSIYLKYLHSLVKKLNLNKVILLGTRTLPIFAIPFSIYLLSMNVIIAPLLLIVSILSLIGIVMATFTSNTAIGRLLLPFKMSKVIKLKIKRITKLLSKKTEVSLKVDNGVNKQEVKQDIYKNSIINYMSTIMDGANKLSKNDRRQKLLELRGILDEYTNKCQELHKSSTKLTLTDSERTIAIQTLDKLTTLEMEIAEMIRRDTENSKVVSESEDLREKINEYLAVVSADEKEISTKKNDDTKKVRVRAI